MSKSCSQYNLTPNSDAEIQAIHDSIVSVSNSTGVDSRFILAIVMQESNGCVRVPTTDGGVRNPGLMQDHNGKGTCNTGNSTNPAPVTPCPSDQILQMIKDGTEGTIDYLGPDVGGPGLKQLLKDAAGTGGAEYYRAARMYNSGSIASNGNLGDGIATHCYSSDVANRLLGWSAGESKCNPETIGTLTQGVGSFVPGNTGASSTTTTTPPAAASPAAQTPATTTTPAVQPTNTPAAPAPPASTATTAPAVPAAPASSPSSGSDGSSSAPPTGPKYPGAVPNCKAYVLVVSGDYCQEVEQDVGISASQFLDWNPGLNTLCSNLWLGYEYCIKA